MRRHKNNWITALIWVVFCPKGVSSQARGISPVSQVKTLASEKVKKPFCAHSVQRDMLLRPFVVSKLISISDKRQRRDTVGGCPCNTHKKGVKTFKM